MKSEGSGKIYVIIGSSLIGAGLLIIILCFVLGGGEEVVTEPDPQNAEPGQAVSYVSSQAFTEKPDKYKYQYLKALLKNNNNPALRKRFISKLENLSEQEIKRVKDNAIDATKSRMLADARKYKKLKSERERGELIESSLEEMMPFKEWLHDMRENPRLRDDTPQTHGEMFNEMMERTTPAEQSLLEGYAGAAMKHYIKKMQSTFGQY